MIYIRVRPDQPRRHDVRAVSLKDETSVTNGISEGGEGPTDGEDGLVPTPKVAALGSLRVMDLMLIFAAFTLGFILGAWLGYYIGRGEEDGEEGV